MKGQKEAKLHWTGFRVLVAMQLQEQLSLSFEADKKKTLTKLILYAVGLIAMTAAIYFAIFILSYLKVLGNGILPVNLLNIFVYILLIIYLFSSVHRLTKSLYFDKSNVTLLTYPVNSGVIFLSKLLVFYVVELVKGFIMFCPLFIAYGIAHGLVWYYYPWVIFAFLVLSLFTSALCALLSLPWLGGMMVLKRYSFLQAPLAFIILLAFSILLFRWLDAFPSDLHIATKWATTYYPAIIDFANELEGYVGPLVFVSQLFVGYRGYAYDISPKNLHIASAESWAVAGAFIGVAIALLGLSFLVLKPLFFSLASKPFEYRRKSFSHEFKFKKSDANLYGTAFVLKDENGKNENFNGDLRQIRREMTNIIKEEKLFLKGEVKPRRVLRYLNAYSKGKSWKSVSIDEAKCPYYAIEYRNGVPALILVEKEEKDRCLAFDPSYLKKKNRPKAPIFSFLYKEILIDLRSPGLLVSRFLMFIVPPLAIGLLNAIFGAINTSFQGDALTVMFNVLVVLLIVLTSSIPVASIYSRDGDASYLLKAAPVSYYAALTIKFLIRIVLMTGSLILTCVIFSRYSGVSYLRVDLLFFTFLFVYLGHLIWSAELDFIKPKTRLYSEFGGGNVNNPNEALSTAIAFLISFIMMGLTYFFVSTEVSMAFVKLLIIAFCFFATRVLLFFLKIKAYGASASEGGDGR